MEVNKAAYCWSRAVKVQLKQLREFLKTAPLREQPGFHQMPVRAQRGRLRIFHSPSCLISLPMKTSERAQVEIHRSPSSLRRRLRISIRSRLRNTPVLTAADAAAVKEAPCRANLPFPVTMQPSGWRRAESPLTMKTIDIDSLPYEPKLSYIRRTYPYSYYLSI